MKNGPDKADGSPFTPLDRFVMEVFRTVSPNAGSLSALTRARDLLGADFTGAVTSHLSASMDPRQWEDPTEFNPDRYKTAPTTVDNDAAKAKEVGFARCPFSPEAFRVKDGRNAEITNSAFGAAYAVVDGKPHPVVDKSGYAPFGFGYRRCPGELLTMEFVKEYLRAIWKNNVTFVKLDIEKPGQVPVNPKTILNDDIAFKRAK
jgi:cytochrome P450